MLAKGLWMPKRKNLTSEEQHERFRAEEKRRVDAGMLSKDDQDDAIDAMIKKNIRDYGP